MFCGYSLAHRQDCGPVWKKLFMVVANHQLLACRVLVVSHYFFWSSIIYFVSNFWRYCVNLFFYSLVSPTNPTPPDSLTSDDSSYMSAKDNSSVASMSTARVRFSPVTLLDLPTQGQHQDSTVPLQAFSHSSRGSSIPEFFT